MKAFDPNYKLLDEMYQDDYYPAFLVDKVKDELQKVIDLLESGETDTEVIQETLDQAVCGINDLQEEFDEHDSEIETVARECALPGFVDSKNEEKTERNAGYLVVSQSGGGMLRQGTRKGIRRTPANRGMRAHRIVKSLDISEDVCHGLCP